MALLRQASQPLAWVTVGGTCTFALLRCVGAFRKSRRGLHGGEGWLGPVFSGRTLREQREQQQKQQEHPSDVAAAATAAPLKKSMLYTKTGDKGESSLYNGERRSKLDDTFEALGACDELNAAVGVAREYCIASRNGLHGLLEEIQCHLLDIGSAIATPKDKSSDAKLQRTLFDAAATAQLEAAIDALDSRVPPLRAFILPSGGLSATHLHVARTVCRRAERRALPLVESNQTDEDVLKYLNRLSDFFFAAARYASVVEEQKETEWRKT